MSDHFPTKTTAGDVAHQIGRAIAGLAPGGADLLNNIIIPPLQRRREAFINGLSERLIKLEHEDRINFAELGNNEEFVSTVMHASHVAIQTHRLEKIDALRNAVLNTALGHAPEDSKREMFLGFVDAFTVIHLQTLGVLKEKYDDQPEDYDGPSKFKSIGITPFSLARKVRLVRPELVDDYKLVILAVEDLCRRKLLYQSQGNESLLPQGVSLVTDLGQDFLKFIAEPQENR
ncbi:MAG TPA: hypothetical protein ENL03_01410 [Phycisphaerae bacterium]|nr:hypothetical protein [Phycisphaerae bacterium]